MTTANRDLGTLNPRTRRKVEAWLADCPEIFVTEAGRSAERQAELFANGKSEVRVSNHQKGLAVDIAFRGKELYPKDHSRWRKVADIAKKHGLEWGYDLWFSRYKYVDKPHFQDNGLNSKEIEANERILERRMEKAQKALDEANAVKKYISLLKGKDFTPYKII